MIQSSACNEVSWKAWMHLSSADQDIDRKEANAFIRADALMEISFSAPSALVFAHVMSRRVRNWQGSASRTWHGDVGNFIERFGLHQNHAQHSVNYSQVQIHILQENWRHWVILPTSCAFPNFPLRFPIPSWLVYCWSCNNREGYTKLLSAHYRWVLRIRNARSGQWIWWPLTWAATKCPYRPTAVLTSFRCMNA